MERNGVGERGGDGDRDGDGQEERARREKAETDREIVCKISG